MESNLIKKVKSILDNYLEGNNQRKTPERYAILNAVYSIDKHFTLDELGEYIESDNFRVSRATLYNTMRLFIKLRLVIRHHLTDGIKYEACYNNDNHCHQVCTMCGKVTELTIPSLVTAFENVKLKRFKKDGFVLYIYGICSVCQGKQTRMKTCDKENLKNNKL